MGEIITYFDENHELFKNTELYRRLQKDFVNLYPDFVDKIFNVIPENRSHRSELFDNSTCYYSMFVYLQLLLEKNPTNIADIGCGLNFVKKYIPGVIGFDSTPEADYQEFFDDKFIDKHRHEFDCAFAVNSVHFIPLEKFKDRIIKFSKIVKPGGRGFLTFNLARMANRKEYKNFIIEKHSEYIDQEVELLKTFPGIKILVYDNMIIQNVKKHYEIYRGNDWPEFDDKSNTDLPKEIRNELVHYGFLGDNQENSQRVIEDPYNGNIRIVFEVDI